MRAGFIFKAHPDPGRVHAPGREMILLAVLWILAALLVDPRGEFPLNDDWSFARPVKTLAETGRLEMSEWPAMSLIAHIGWGWLVSSAFGFSFFALRISVAALGLAGVLAIRQTLLELTGDPEKASLGALAVGFNAIYFNLSFTFMTDVPFFLLATLSVYCFARGLRASDLHFIAAGVLLASLATLIRQVGLFLPAAFAAAHVVRERGAPRAWLRGIGAIAFVYGVLFAYEAWMQFTVGLPAIYSTYEADVWRKIMAGPVALARNTAGTLMDCSILLGLFMFPVLALELPRRGLKPTGVVLFLAASGLALGVFLCLSGRCMPFLDRGIFTDFALGPITLRDVFHLERDNCWRAPRAVLWLITCLGCVGAFWLARHIALCAWNAVRYLFLGQGDGFRAGVQALGAGAALAILLPLAIKMPFDRYLLSCVPGLLAAVACSGAGRPARWQTALASLFILGSAAFAVAGTHDYLAWNRARWQALDCLCSERKIPPEQIDGGFEFNGWRLFDPRHQDDGVKTWWWVHDDVYTVTFGMIENYFVSFYVPYERWCPPQSDFITVLEKRGENSACVELAATFRYGGRNVKTGGQIYRYWEGDRFGKHVLVCWGATVRLPPGDYRARFHLAAGARRGAWEQDAGFLRLVEAGTGRLIAESPVSFAERAAGRFGFQDLRFTAGTNMHAEIQVIGAHRPLWLSRVRFIREKEGCGQSKAAVPAG